LIQISNGTIKWFLNAFGQLSTSGAADCPKTSSLALQPFKLRQNQPAHGLSKAVPTQAFGLYQTHQITLLKFSKQHTTSLLKKIKSPSQKW
jgi:hypothetical protein